MTSCFSSGTASDSICPKGWRLPGNSGSGSYRELLRFYSNADGLNGKNLDTIVLLHQSVFTRSGDYDYISGFFGGRMSNSSYFTNGINSSLNAYIFTFSGSYLTRYQEARGFGFVLRCLAR